jgi:hypothetical protein
MRSSKVERWLEGKETPLLLQVSLSCSRALSDSLAPLSLSHTVSSRFLQGLRMGETLGVGSFGEVRVGTLPSGEHCAVKVRGPASRPPSVSLSHTHVGSGDGPEEAFWYLPQ